LEQDQVQFAEKPLSVACQSFLSGGLHRANQRKFTLKEIEMTRDNRLGKVGLKALTIGLMAMGLAVGASALTTKNQPAYAYNPKAGGQPGEIQVPVTQGAYQVEAVITFPARYAWRSNAYAGTQVITVTYTLWKYNAASGTWGLYNSRPSSAQVTVDGIGSWFGAWTTPVPLDSFAVNVQVNWATLDGVVFGWKVIDYNTATDYQCLTGPTCSVLPNASVGAFVYLHPVAPQPVATAKPTQEPTQSSGGSSVTIPGGSDPAYGSASSDSSQSVTYTSNSQSDYAALFGGAGGQNDARCYHVCRLFNDYPESFRFENNGTDDSSQFAQAGQEMAWTQNAGNNPDFGRATLR
jgi:hypothetical protein